MELVHTFEKVNNIKVNYKIVDRRPGDIGTCYADATRAQTELGFKTTHSVEDMCKSSWEFIKNN